MKKVFLLKNQDDQFLDKSGQWVQPTLAKALFRTEHKDEALNSKLELSVKNDALRITLCEADYDSKGNPVVGSANLTERRATAAIATESPLATGVAAQPATQTPRVHA